MRDRTKYLIAGVLFGLCFPIGAFVLEWLLTGNSNPMTQHESNKLLFMIDSAPIFLGLFALVGGIYQEKSKAYAKEQKRLADELTLAMEDLKSSQEAILADRNKIDLSMQTINKSMIFFHDFLDKIHNKSSNLEKASREIVLGHDHVINNQNEIVDESEVLASDMKDSITELMSLEKILNKFSTTSGNALNVLVDEMHIMKEIIDGLDQINSLKVSIDAISDQIDMLALNASIEASRAGQYGAGFAVVANEIKKLSLESSQSTGEMAVYLNKLKEDYTGSYMQMTRVVDEMKTSVTSLMTLVAKMNQMKDVLKKDQSSSQGITSLCESQFTELKSLNDCVTSISNQIIEINSLSDETYKFINEMKRGQP